MTVSERSRFVAAWTGLELALNVRPDDRAAPAKIQIIFDTLADIPIDLVEAAARRLASTASYWPKPIEWREAVDAVQDERRRSGKLLRALPAPGEGPVFECERCEDTGWEYLDCKATPGSRAECGRDRPHAPHSFVVPCSCRATNARYQAEHCVPKRYAQTAKQPAPRRQQGQLTLASNVREFVRREDRSKPDNADI